jgi:hypothetical protein
MSTKKAFGRDIYSLKSNNNNEYIRYYHRWKASKNQDLVDLTYILEEKNNKQVMKEQ